jgi:hypothetical protein
LPGGLHAQLYEMRALLPLTGGGRVLAR